MDFGSHAAQETLTRAVLSAECSVLSAVCSVLSASEKPCACMPGEVRGETGQALE